MKSVLKNVIALLCIVPCLLLLTRVDRWTAAAQPTGLVAAYGFEEGSGTSVADASGNGHTGTLATGTTWTTAGRFGAALQFNGTTSGVTVPDARVPRLVWSRTLGFREAGYPRSHPV